MHPAVEAFTPVNWVDPDAPGWFCGEVDPEKGHGPLAVVAVEELPDLEAEEPHALTTSMHTARIKALDRTRRRIAPPQASASRALPSHATLA
jgi:hypothetical protein